MNVKQIASVLGLVLLIALVAPFVVYALPGAIGGEASFIVLSGSMEPGISSGDAVIVSERAPESIEVGDVITFVRGQQSTPVTHRVVGVEEIAGGVSFQTKGDANEDVDPEPVPGANVIGVVTLTIPYIGYVVQTVNSPVGFVALVVVPIGLLVLTELWSLFAASRNVPPESEAADERGADAKDGTGKTDETESARPAETDGESGGETLSISAGELRLAALALALLTPYIAYVAVQLRTTLALSVAFGSALGLLTVGGLWLSAVWEARSAGATVEESNLEAVTEFDSATDGGIPEESER